jgi:hypothetical protein
MRTTTLITATVIGATALLVSGCATTGEPGDDEPKRVTINSILGVPDYSEVDWQDQDKKIQEAVAACMREEGWEYIPVEQPDGAYNWTPEDELENYKRQGFGIVWYTLHRGEDTGENDPYKDWVDPNQEYVESLSESEQTAYYESLYGTQEEQMEGQVTEIDPETGEEYQVQYGYGPGCYGDAYKEIQGDDITQTPEYNEAMQEYWDELSQRYEADERIVDLNKEWASCMKGAGYNYATQDELWTDAYQDIQERHDEIVGEDVNQDPFEGWTEDEINDFFENTPQEEIDEFFNKPFDLTDEQRSQLEALLQEEIDLAVAQYECSKPLNEQLTDIYADIEEKFALEHEDELRALAASLADKQ